MCVWVGVHAISSVENTYTHTCKPVFIFKRIQAYIYIYIYIYISNSVSCHFLISWLCYIYQPLRSGRI